MFLKNILSSKTFFFYLLKSKNLKILLSKSLERLFRNKKKVFWKVAKRSSFIMSSWRTPHDMWTNSVERIDQGWGRSCNLIYKKYFSSLRSWPLSTTTAALVSSSTSWRTRETIESEINKLLLVMEIKS